jgi:ABC-type enterobactin transport system permease subunit
MSPRLARIYMNVGGVAIIVAVIVGVALLITWPISGVWTWVSTWSAVGGSAVGVGGVVLFWLGDTAEVRR